MALAVKMAGFCRYEVACVLLPACIFYGVDGTLTLLLPALHIRL